MKTIELNLYEYKELKGDARQAAREHFRFVLVDNEHWFDHIYCEFMEFASALGVAIQGEKIFFSGFHAQGDGSSFEADIDVVKLISSVAARHWKNAPLPGLYLPSCPCDKRVLRLILSGGIQFSASVASPLQVYRLKHSIMYSFGVDDERSLPRIERELVKFAIWVESTLERLNRALYHRLEEDYEELISDETVADTISHNGYLFTADGKHADHLLELAASVK